MSVLFDARFLSVRHYVTYQHHQNLRPPAGWKILLAGNGRTFDSGFYKGAEINTAWLSNNGFN